MISILLPTRARPHRLKRFLDSVASTAANPKNIEILLYIDDDDQETRDLLPLIIEGQPFDCSWSILGYRQQFLGKCINRLAEWAKGDILHLAADDTVFHLNHWDNVVEGYFSLFPDKIALLHGETPDLPTHPFISLQSVKILGYALYPEFEHGYLDYWLAHMYNKVGRRVFDPTLGPCHEHWHANPIMRDDTYDFRQAPDESGLTPDERDKIRWDMLQNKLNEEALKLQEYINGYKQ